MSHFSFSGLDNSHLEGPFLQELKAGGKPPTWLPPGGLVERFAWKLPRKTEQVVEAKQFRAKTTSSSNLEFSEFTQQ